MAPELDPFAEGWKHHQAGNLRQAEQIYRQMLDRHPRRAEGWYLLGVLLQAQGKLEEALPALEQALQLDPAHLDARNALGVVLAGQGKLAEAEAMIRRVLDSRPRHQDACNNLGIILRRQGRLPEAVAAFREVLRLNPENPEVHNNLGIALRGQGKPQEAEASHREALRLRPNFSEACNNLGIVLAEQGQLEEAVQSYRRALELRPRYAEAYNNLGNALRRLQRVDEAVASFRRSLELRPRHAETLTNLGVALVELGQKDEAVACYTEALRLKPDYVEAHNNLGIVFTDQGRLDQAVSHLRQALQLRPAYAEAHNNLGNAYREQGQLEEAAACIREALRLKPDLVAGFINLGNVLKDQGKLDEAIASYQHALRLDPRSVEALNNLGSPLVDQGKLDEAIASYRQALDLDPDNVEALSNLGSALAQQDKFDEAVACFEQALRLKPDHAGAHANLGAVFLRQGQLERALASFERALYLDPENPDVHLNVGATVLTRGDPNEAVARFQHALNLKPDLASAHYNRALVWLLQGDYERGWPEYEWRWKCKDAAPRSFPQPLWDGTPLQGKVILLHAEQGLGDTIQFLRYAALVKERGGVVVLESPRSLLGLAATCPGIDQLVARGETLPAFDVHAPLLSLPALVGTTLATVPAPIPYLKARPDLVEFWRHELGKFLGFKVGIAWQGNPQYKADRQRSIPLAQFAPLARRGGVQLLSLQKSHGIDQLRAVANEFPVIDLGSRLDESSGPFMDTAAVMMNLDLVIAPDTAVAHLAGALGVPVWVPLPFAPDWRWLLGRDDSPWYPTARLFRQTRPGDWPGVFERIASLLPADSPRRAAARPSSQPASCPPAASTLAHAADWLRAGRLEEAEQACRQVLESQPRNVDALHLLGVVVHQAGHREAARDYLEQALRLRPDLAEAHYNLGNLLRDLGDHAQAGARFREAIRLRPNHAEAYYNLGNLLREKDLNEAIDCYRQAVRHRPRFARAHNNLGNALLELGQADEAVAAFEQAVRAEPGSARFHVNLGNALCRVGQCAEAVRTCRRALELEPNSAESHTSLGAALLEQGQVDDALAAFEQALRHEPEDPRAHMNRALTQLLLGNYRAGWPEYEWRWRCPEFTPRSYRQPRWDGTPLAGRTIFLYAEQGLGDTLQFLRFASVVKQGGGTVIAEVQAPLLKLLKGCPAVDHLVGPGAVLPEFDVQAPLLSLPAILGTTLETLPAPVPYLHAPADLQEQWRREVGSLPGFKVGIAWQGNRQFRGDRQRSIPLAEFAPLAGIEGIHLISLQKGAGTEQLTALKDRLPILDLATRLDDGTGPFLDTAAIMKNLDLVITPNTALAHLAGALGVPVWVVLPVVPDWRWLLERADSPWYPTVRLFRQERPGDWAGVFHRIADELRARLASFPRDTVRAAAVPAVRNRLRQCRHGQMICPANDRWIGKSLELYGEFSEGEVALFRRLVRPGDMVLDIGAHVGTHTVPLAQFVGPDGQVLAFEPQRLLFQCLCGNLALNSLTNVVCHQAAVGAASGSIAVPELNGTGEVNYGGLELHPGRPASGSCSVPLLRIDDLKLTRCDLVKIDVEGMEKDVLEGAVETIRAFKPLLYVEDDRFEKSLALRAFLKDLGYDVYVHAPPFYNPDNYAGNRENVFGALQSLNLFCCHRAAPLPIRPDEFRMGTADQFAPGQVPCVPDVLVPEDPTALHDRGNRLLEQGKLEEAVACQRQALQLRPDYPESACSLGSALRQLGRLDEALACLRDASSRWPGSALVHNSLGNVLRELGRFEEAVAAFRQALALQPNFPEAFNNLGNAYQAQTLLPEALENYGHAIEIRPDYALAHYNRALAWLLQGDWERGWPEYVWRWQCKGFVPRPFPQPRWDGSPLAGRTILLRAEQGLGDTLQFVRYCPLVQERGGTVIFECPRPLVGLVTGCAGIDRLVMAGDTLPRFEVHASLLDLPGILGTTLATIPGRVPYLAARSDLVEKWRPRLGRGLGFRVGIAWQGDPKYGGDRQRSIPLAEFAPLARVAGVVLESLQKGPGSEQAAAQPFAVTDLGSELDEAGPFLDTAAVMRHLDLVITADTALAHLAGGLGVPVWVAVPFFPDWRWLLQREDSPWYPTARLFRQTRAGKWEDVFERMAATLTERLSRGEETGS